MERNWQYFVYFFAGAALIAFLARRRGNGRGLGMVAFAIFVVLGLLLLFNALGRPA